MENILYGVQIYEDCGGGGIVAIFSTEQKAKDYAISIELGAVDSVEVVTIKLDDPEYIENIRNTYRHG